VELKHCFNQVIFSK